MTIEHHPIIPLNALLPYFRKVVKGFRDNGDYWLMLHFYQGGLRTPRIMDSGDKQGVKQLLADFLKVWGKPKFTGQITFYLKHGEFTDIFNVYPGSGSFDTCKKEGIAFKVNSYQEYNSSYDDPWFFRIDNVGVIETDIPI